MSDTADDHDVPVAALLGTSESTPLRERMQSFVDQYETAGSLEALRGEQTTGATLSDLVDEGRSERL